MVWVNLGLTIIGFAVSITVAIIVSKKRCDKRLKAQKEKIMEETQTKRSKK